jgi:RNA polymerase sigma-70 factor (ECF subfamily)
MYTATSQDNFLQLIEANKGIIIKICNSYCKDRHDREDLAQEIVYNLWKAGKNFNPDYKFSTWMYRVALNVAISFYRNRQRSVPVYTLSDWHINIEEPVCTDAASEENMQLLLKFIAEMKELDKALVLLWLEAKSYKEIAEILGITESNVATRISRSKEKLKQQLLNTKK